MKKYTLSCSLLTGIDVLYEHHVIPNIAYSFSGIDYGRSCTSTWYGKSPDLLNYLADRPRHGHPSESRVQIVLWSI